MTKRKTFLVESYLPRSRAAELDAAVARLHAFRVAGPPSPPVAYLSSFYVAEDEVCYHLFRATSAAAVRAAAESAAIPVDHVGEAEQHLASRRRRPGTTA